ncbi:MAG: hypothetical protein ACLFWF_13030 [Alphaproteobacteria bacterium]
MGKSRSSSLFRAIGLYAFVLVIVALVAWPVAYLVPCWAGSALGSPGLRHAINWAPAIWWNLLPQLAFYALVITVFAMNRIRSAALVVLGALMVMMFISWTGRCVSWQLIDSDLFWRFHNAFAGRLPEGVDAFFVYAMVLLPLFLAGAFLIIKLVAAAERAFMGRKEPA